MKANGENRQQQDSQDDFPSALRSAIDDFGLNPLDEEALSRLAAHFKLLSDWNRKSNLTRITNVREAARLHYAESIFAARFVERSASLLDVGSGAGFPAVPVAVVRPDVRVTALEPNLKKNVFLKEAKDALRLDNFQVVRARIEEFNWSGFQVITTRAVERASELVPSMVRQLGERQTLVLFCTQGLADELSAEFQAAIDLELHPIPGSNERLVAVVRCR